MNLSKLSKKWNYGMDPDKGCSLGRAAVLHKVCGEMLNDKLSEWIPNKFPFCTTVKGKNCCFEEDKFIFGPAWNISQQLIKHLIPIQSPSNNKSTKLLQRMAMEYFSQIPNKNGQLPILQFIVNGNNIFEICIKHITQHTIAKAISAHDAV